MSGNTISHFPTRRRIGIVCALGALLTGAALSANAQSATTSYSINGMPAAGGLWSIMHGPVDDRGYKIGAITIGYNANNNPITRATLWNQYEAADSLTMQGQFPGSVANDANAVGGVAGAAADDPEGDLCPVYWHIPFPVPHGPVSGLGDPVYFTLPPGLSGQGLAINDQFQMVGWEQVASPTLPLPPPHAYLFDPARGRIDLGTLGGNASTATGINNAGQIVGWAEVAEPTPHPWRHAFTFSFSAGMQDLGTLGGNNSEADYIDDDGWTVGWSEKFNPAHPDWHYAFYYAPALGMQELPLPSGQVQGEALAINPQKWIVGRTLDAAGNSHPALWMPVANPSQYEPTDPNIYLAPDSGWVLQELVGINNSGQLFGNGTNKGKAQGFVLSPSSVPGVIAGQMAFQGYLGTALQSVQLEFRPTNGDPTFNQQIAVGPDGAFQLGGIPQQPYTLHVKSAKYLAQNVPIDLTEGAVGGLQLTLPAGDANDDNSVDVSDFSVLINAYGTVYDPSSPGNGYDSNADFNGDGSVDVQDFGILINNYGALGNP